MTQVLQFNCSDINTVSQITTLMSDIANNLSRLSYLADESGYVTSPFNANDWLEHTQTAGLYWINWDAVYAALGDNGRHIADVMILPLMVGQAFSAFPGIILALENIADLIAAGYLPADQEN